MTMKLLLRLYRLAPAFAFIIMPLIAHADDEDARPLSPEQLSAQRTALGVIGTLIIAAIGFYFFRRWQTVRSGNTIEGGYRDDE